MEKQVRSRAGPPQGGPEAERFRQAARCLDCGIPFCQSGIVFDGKRLGCPLHNLIPEWNDMLRRGNPTQALSRLLKTNCFPEFTGRVCPAFCQMACTRALCGEPVTVRENELFIIEYAFQNGLMKPQPPAARSGKTVAVVGSGPAGLTAAHYLNRRGHLVTVLEREAEPGGLLLGGIPDKKLPKEIVRRRIDLMEREGVRFRTGVEAGKDPDAGTLAREYDCIILSCGSKRKPPAGQPDAPEPIAPAVPPGDDAEKFFPAGDMRNGPSLVVLAIADGKRAAAEADCFLMGYTNIE
ncbi:MAG TPA: FAD-dependent oxidoreductase [Oscillospiraceae bacterium]|nr:FAD-dependent oxidoreductase [Oscillospiraceae bacterium]